MSPPLVTFALFAYKQERFIREAVGGAFAQTYSPLEIILSDDHSPDRTFEIMQEMAAAYPGPHKIVLNRNPKNLGLAGHVNRVMDMAQGELIIMAAGDDISLPERAEYLTREWLAYGQPSGIASAAIIVDAANRELGEWPATGHYPAAEINRADQETLLSFFTDDPAFCLLGCAAAWSKALWKTFGPLPASVSNEDCALTFRSCFVKGICIVTVPLVKYRHHDQNIWSQALPHILTTPDQYLILEDSIIRHAKAHHHLYGTLLADLDQAISIGLATKSQTSHVCAAIEKRRQEKQLAGDWWNLSISHKLSALGTLEDRAAIKLLKLLPNKMAYVTCRASAARIKKLFT